jgi:hypothetical protein
VSGKETMTLRHERVWGFMDLCFDREGTSLYAMTRDRQIRVFSATTPP